MPDPRDHPQEWSTARWNHLVARFDTRTGKVEILPDTARSPYPEAELRRLQDEAGVRVLARAR
jgi:hypothetical protein